MAKAFYGCTVSAEGTAQLTTWRTQSGGTANGGLKYTYSRKTFSADTVLNKLNSGKAYFGKMSRSITSPNPNYAFVNLPECWVSVNNTSVSTPNDIYEAGIKSVMMSHGNSSDGYKGTASFNLTSSELTFFVDYYKYYVTVNKQPDNGGTVTKGNAYYKENTSVTLTATPKTGYKFLKWSDGSTSNKKTIVVSSDVTYTAYFSNNYKIVFNANGGTGSMSDQSFTNGVPQNLTSNTFTRTGYVFAGWNTQSDGGGTSYTNGQSVDALSSTPDGVVTLYAQWRRPYVYIVNSDTNKGSLSLYSISEGKTVATESNGVIAFDNVVSGRVYRIDCTIKNVLYESKGILLNNSYATSFTYNIPIEQTFEYRTKPTCFIDVKKIDSKGDEIVENCGTVSISPNANITIDGKDKWIPQLITFTVIPTEGWDFKAYNITTKNDATLVSENASSKDVKLQLTADVVANFIFAKKVYRVNVDLDEEAKNVNAGAVSDSKDIEHGAVIELSANANDGYIFEGWYIDGANVSNESTYSYTVTSNVNIFAKFQCEVNLSLYYNGESEHSSILTVNEEVCEGGQYHGICDIGATLDIKITNRSKEGEGGPFEWYLQKWERLSPNGEYEEIDASLNFKVRITKALTLRACLVDSPRANTITAYIFSWKKVDIIKTTDSLSPETVVSLEILPEHVRMLGFAPPPEEAKKYTVIANQSCYVNATAVESITVNGNQEFFRYFVSELIENDDGSFSVDEEKIISTSNSLEVLANTSKSIYAVYGEISDVTVRLDYGIGNRTMGTFSLDGESNETTEDGTVSVVRQQLEDVNVKVVAKNGYRFVGWYKKIPIAGSPSYVGKDITITVVTQMTLYAFFEEDPNAIYEWEGSDENKMMVWKSKVYSATKPFNPSACRVEALNYPKPLGELSIGVFSSPDDKPTSVTSLTNITSQDARRLPVMRSEKYLQVSVENDEEVDSITISTSMGGLLA